jgi:hypothetical protein
MALVILTVLFAAEYLISARRRQQRMENDYRTACDRRLEALCQQRPA